MSEKVETIVIKEAGEMGKALEKSLENPEVKVETKQDQSVFIRQKHVLVLKYSNLAVPFIQANIYANDVLEQSLLLQFKDYEMEDGVPASLDQVFNILNDAINYDFDEVDLALAASESFKVTSTFPKMNKSKARSLYAKAIKDELASYKHRSASFVEEYEHELGHVFYTYFMPIKVVNFFAQLALKLGSKLTKIDMLERYIQQRMSASISSDYVYHFEIFGTSGFVVSYGGILSGSCVYDSKVDTTIGQYTAVVFKHFCEVEKKEIAATYALDPQVISFIPEVSQFEIDETNYFFKGVKF